MCFLNTCKRKENEKERRIGKYNRKIITICISKHIDKFLYKKCTYMLLCFMTVNLKDKEGENITMIFSPSTQIDGYGKNEVKKVERRRLMITKWLYEYKT